MKVFTATLLLFSLQLVWPVYSDNLSDLMSQLIDVVYKGSLAANGEISLQYAKSLDRMDTIFEENVLPSIEEVYGEIDAYIADLENRTTSSGFDVHNCVSSVQESLRELPNVTLKAKKEILDVFEKIQSYTLFIAQRNIDVISKELDSIATEYTRCTLSQQPQYCNSTLPDLLASKQEQFPDLYNKEIQRTNLAFLREIGNFESRSDDYIMEIISGTKIYLSLLENCVAAVLVA